MQDSSKIKEKIISIIQQKGPSLPVRIASDIGISPLFASAFLSELLSQKKLKISNLRVGNSPLYFISGQEPDLENFSDHLNSKEKEAFLLLKEKSFLVDEEQHPAIKVALRSIKDFAMGFEKDNKFIWRYFVVPEENYAISVKEELKEEKKDSGESKEVVTHRSREARKESGEAEESKPVKKKLAKKKTRKNNEEFFNQVKGYLSSKSIEILDIVGISSSELVFKVKEGSEEKLVVAYNKKRISEADILKAYKKSEELSLNYTILSVGEPLKRVFSLLEAAKTLSSIEKLE